MTRVLAWLAMGLMALLPVANVQASPEDCAAYQMQEGVVKVRISEEPDQGSGHFAVIMAPKEFRGTQFDIGFLMSAAGDLNIPIKMDDTGDNVRGVFFGEKSRLKGFQFLGYYTRHQTGCDVSVIATIQ